MTTDIDALIERLEAATGPDRELDAAIFAWSEGGRIHYFDALAKNYVWERPIDGFWIRGVKSVPSTTKFTASIDAALALCERMLPGWSWKIVGEPGAVYPHCAVLRNAGKLSDVAEAFVASHRTAPLAMVSALLLALRATDTGTEKP